MAWPKNVNTKHGGARRGRRSPEYSVWVGMRRRCADTENMDYGGRGIGVCERWDSSFDSFLEDMGERPTSAHTLERKDNNVGYEPGNCVWATRSEQAQNRRQRTKRTHCARGHGLSGENVYSRPDGKRGCRECRRLNMTNYYRAHA